MKQFKINESMVTFIGKIVALCYSKVCEYMFVVINDKVYNIKPDHDDMHKYIVMNRRGLGCRQYDNCDKSFTTAFQNAGYYKDHFDRLNRSDLNLMTPCGNTGILFESCLKCTEEKGWCMLKEVFDEILKRKNLVVRKDGFLEGAPTIDISNKFWFKKDSVEFYDDLIRIEFSLPSLMDQTQLRKEVKDHVNDIISESFIEAEKYRTRFKKRAALYPEVKEWYKVAKIEISKGRQLYVTLQLKGEYVEEYK